jgi:hypothetical protein
MAETHLLQIQLGPCAPCHMQCLQNSQDNPAPFVWTSRRKWAWLLESSTAGCDDGGWGWVQPVQVRGRFYSGWRSLLTGSDATIFLSLVLLWTSMPRRVVLVGLHRPFRNEELLPSSPPPGSQGAAPAQVDEVPSRDTFYGGKLGSRSHFGLVLACSFSLLASSGCLSLCPRLASPGGGDSCPRPAFPTPWAPMPQALRQLLSQPCLQARCWWFPWSGLVWRPRPTGLPLAHAHRLPLI